MNDNTTPAVPPNVPTRQEMLDRAVRGLRSQGFRKAADNGYCAYEFKDGRRCAWGWVDASLTIKHIGTVISLHEDGIGIAARLSTDGDDNDLRWARTLQRQHDDATSDPADLEHRLREFAAKSGLVFPEAEQ